MSKQISSAEADLPADIYAWLTQSTACEIENYQRNTGGGASRQGAFLSVVYNDGKREEAYLTFDLRAEAASERLAGITAEISAIIEVGANTAMQVPQVLSYSEPLRAMLTRRVTGESAFNKLTDAAERETVAADFMVQLAALHTTPVAQLPIKGLGEPQLPSLSIQKRLQQLSDKYQQVAADPLLTYALQWLANNIPADPADIVLVHGDAGPANFLYENGKVTTVLDWEMTHYGDPMEDMAWIAIRDLFEPFVALPFCFKVYEQAGGVAVDSQKVRYYRAYALINLVIESYIDIHWGQGEFDGVIGNNLVFYSLHRRALLEGIAEYQQVVLTPQALPKMSPSPQTRSFDIALNELRQQVLPRVNDVAANAQLRALTRMLKYWQQRDVVGQAFDTQGLAQINTALEKNYETLAEAQAALVKIIDREALSNENILDLLGNQLAREMALVKSAMGPLAGRHFSALV